MKDIDAEYDVESNDLVDLLGEAVAEGYVTCRECGLPIEVDTCNCPECGWFNKASDHI